MSQAGSGNTQKYIFWQTPTSGATIVTPSGYELTVLLSTVLLATLSVQLPTEPYDTAHLICTGAFGVTALSVLNPSGGLIGSTLSLAGNSSLRFGFQVSTGTWTRIG